MTLRRWGLVGCVLTSCLLPAVGWAQSPPVPPDVAAAMSRGRVQGFVFEQGSGAPLVGATVMVGAATALTDTRGRFEVALSPGRHELVVIGADGVPRPSVAVNVVAGITTEVLLTWSTDRMRLPALVEEPEAVDAPVQAETVDGPAGRIRGRVRNDEDGSAVAGARVYVRGRSVEGITDAEGAFELPLPEGSWELAVVANAFASQSVAEVLVVADTATEVDVALVPAGLALEDFYVRAPAVTGGDAALMDERRESSNVADVIGAEQMARAGDSSAASALARVTGLTLVGGQFVYVRGLGERYSTTLLNGANLPSPDPERRVVPLDMFPAAILESVIVQKTFSPDMPAEFGGGAVTLRTRSIPSEPLFRVGLTGGWQEGATFTQGLLGEPGKTDFLGVDGGYRAIPAEVAATEAGSVEQGDRFGNGVAADDLERYGESFNNVWRPTPRFLPPNTGLSLSLGNGWSLGKDKRFGALLGLSYSDRYDTDQFHRRFYLPGSGSRLDATNAYCGALGELPAVLSSPDGAERTASVQNDYCFTTTQRTVRLSGLLALGLEPGKGQKIESTTVVLRNSDDSSLVAEGYYNDIDGDLRLTELRWLERMLISQMVRGTHALAQGDNASEVGWRYVFSFAGRQEPDRRTTRSDLTSDGTFVLSNRPEGNNRFWASTDDRTHDAMAYVKVPIPAGKLRLELKLGAQVVRKDRVVDSRQFKFNTAELDPEVRLQDIEDVFTPENISPDLARLDEVTRNTDRYEASQNIWATYAMVRAPLMPWLDVMAGLRLEHSDQTVITRELFGDSFVETGISNTDPLPAVTATFRPMDQMQVRMGYGRTVSRPEFRELSEVLFREVLGGRQTVGNANLQRATIDSVDLRWEWFPEQGDVVSVSGFFKGFTNPVEPIVVPGAELTTTYENALGARNYGVEFEFRKNLGFATPALRDLFLAANASLIQSSIQLEDGIQTNQERALSGQSPWVINAQFGYDNPELGLTATLLYNVAGPRIVEVGALGFPDTYEAPRHNLDFVFNTQLPKGFELRLVGRNLLNTPTITSINDINTGVRYLAERRVAGRQVSLRLGWRL